MKAQVLEKDLQEVNPIIDSQPGGIDLTSFGLCDNRPEMQLKQIVQCKSDSIPIQMQGTDTTSESVPDVLDSEQERLEARKKDVAELRKLFLVKNRSKGKKQANELDPESFAAIAGMFSDIREGTSALKIGNRIGENTPRRGNQPATKSYRELTEEQSDKFRQDVLQDLAKILQTEVGRKLIQQLHDSRQQVEINLSDDKLQSGATANSQSNKTNGIPSGSTVDYVPNDPSQAIAFDETFLTSDSILFHELTHALHMAQGKYTTGILTASDIPFFGNDIDIGQHKEDFATVGLGRWKSDEITENNYRKQQRSINKKSALKQKMYGKRESYAASELF